MDLCTGGVPLCCLWGSGWERNPTSRVTQKCVKPAREEPLPLIPVSGASAFVFRHHCPCISCLLHPAMEKWVLRAVLPWPH